MRRCIADPQTKRPTSCSSPTAGPTDYAEQSVTATTEWATLELTKHELNPKRFIGASYVVVGDTLEVMVCYRCLDERTSWGPDKVKCDVFNAIYLSDIKALGRPDLFLFPRPSSSRPWPSLPIFTRWQCQLPARHRWRWLSACLR